MPLVILVSSKDFKKLHANADYDTLWYVSLWYVSKGWKDSREKKIVELEFKSWKETSHTKICKENVLRWQHHIWTGMFKRKAYGIRAMFSKHFRLKPRDKKLTLGCRPLHKHTGLR